MDKHNLEKHSATFDESKEYKTRSGRTESPRAIFAALLFFSVFCSPVRTEKCPEPQQPLWCMFSSSLGQSSMSMNSSSSSSSSQLPAGLDVDRFCWSPSVDLPEPEPPSSCCMRLCFVRRFWNHTFTWKQGGEWSKWLLSNACSSLSSCEGEKAVRTRFDLRNGMSCTACRLNGSRSTNEPEQRIPSSAWQNRPERNAPGSAEKDEDNGGVLTARESDGEHAATVPAEEPRVERVAVARRQVGVVKVRGRRVRREGLAGLGVGERGRLELRGQEVLVVGGLHHFRRRPLSSDGGGGPPADGCCGCAGGGGGCDEGLTGKGRTRPGGRPGTTIGPTEPGGGGPPWPSDIPGAEDPGPEGPGGAGGEAGGEGLRGRLSESGPGPEELTGGERRDWSASRERTLAWLPSRLWGLSGSRLSVEEPSGLGERWGSRCSIGWPPSGLAVCDGGGDGGDFGVVLPTIESMLKPIRGCRVGILLRLAEASAD
uniref:Uncharacterized protein n=1 Tax=Anopheles atroparvus TaxID=41427 RepID=A0A182J9X8_ANOAO